MTTLFVSEVPPVVDDWLAERRRLGQDGHDEVWEGVYHVAPYASGEHGELEAELVVVLRPRAKPRGLVVSSSYNLGAKDDFRVPDLGVHRQRPRGVYLPTVAIVVEVLSPDDETMQKLDFYAARSCDELLVADPATRTVRLWQLQDGRYVETGTSGLLSVTAAELESEIDWP